jgi:hypothetical protein
MTHDKGFHMKLRNCIIIRKCTREFSANAHLEKRILLLVFQLIGAKKFQSSLDFLFIEAILVALQELEYIRYCYCLQVDLVLVVQIVSREVYLQRHAHFCQCLQISVRNPRTCDMSIFASDLKRILAPAIEEDS